MNSRGFGRALMLFLLAAAGSIACAAAYAQGKRTVNIAGPSQTLPFSDGMVAGHTLYVSGTQGNLAAATESLGTVIPAKAGIQMLVVDRAMDSRLRGNDSFPNARWCVRLTKKAC